MYIQETLVTDKQIALELSSENGRYRLPIDGQDYYFPTLEKVHEAFLNQDSYDTIKLTHNGKKSYLHLLMDEIEVFDTKEALRQRLSQDSQGMWAEIRNGKKHYYMQERGWMSTSYKEITEQECIENLQRSSTLTKALGIGLGMLALLPGAVEFARHLPIGTKEAAMGLIALNQKNPVLGAVGYSLLPKQVGAQTMGTEFQVNTYTTSDQSYPSVAPLKDRGFVVIWNSISQDGDRYGIFGQRYDWSGAKNGSEFQVNTYTTNNQYTPNVVALVDGGFVVTWASDGQDGDSDGIFGQRYQDSGAKNGTEFQVNTHTTSYQRDPIVAALADGGFVVTWRSYGQDGSEYGVYGQRYDSSGLKSGAEFQINTYTTGNQWYSSVAALADGGFVVTWLSNGQDGDGYGVFGQRYDSSSMKVGTEFQINTYTTSDQLYPSVAAHANGGFVVIWTSDGQDGDSGGIYGQKYDANGTKNGLEFQVNTYTTSSQEYPSVAALANGGFAVTWQSGFSSPAWPFWTFWTSWSFTQDGSGHGTYGQRFDGSGIKLDTEFQVNTYTTSSQEFPKIVPLSDGGFLVIWTSNGQDGDSYGIFGQRYDPIGNPIPLQIPLSTNLTPPSSATQHPPSPSIPLSSFSSTQSALTGSTLTTSKISSATTDLNTQPSVSTPSSRAATSTSASRRANSSSSSIASVDNIVYGQSYPILVNDQVVGSYTVSGGSGLLDSNNSNVIFFEFDPNFQPVEGEVITLFTIPDEEVGLWESIQIEGESIECLEPHGYVDTKLEGSSYQIIFDETTCLAIAPTLLARTLPLTLN